MPQSPQGCRCEFIERPNIGERVWVKFDGLEAIESEVRWLKETSAVFASPGAFPERHLSRTFLEGFLARVCALQTD